MLSFWPAALIHFFKIPFEAFLAANHFDWPDMVMWYGQQILATELPWNYLPVMFCVQIPESVVLLILFATIWGLVRFFRAVRSGEATLARGVGLVLLAALFPPIWAIVNKSTLYDNGRHFLFALPPLLCLTACGWLAFLRFVNNRFSGGKFLLQLLLLVSLVFPVSRMAALHPYEYTFFNAFAGGVPDGADKFDSDYWVTSYREAAKPLLQHAIKLAEATGRSFESINFTVTVVGNRNIFLEELPGNFTVYDEYGAMPTDYFVASSRWNTDNLFPDWPVVARVERLGMLYAVVRVSPELARLVLP
jgi:hypothetical protein